MIDKTALGYLRYLSQGFFYFFLLNLSDPCEARQTDSFTIPETSKQLIVVIPDHWKSTYGFLQRWERKDDGVWKQITLDNQDKRFMVRLANRGLAWGIGLNPLPSEEGRKKEGDVKAPAGVFEIGDAYGYAKEIQKNDSLKYHQVTESDLWVEDSESPYYNQHLTLEGRGPETEWERKQQMRMNDSVHSLKLFIKHNPAPYAIPGAGSAIFFHIWRDEGGKNTYGCTTMSEKNLKKLIAWVDPTKNPLYVLLPREAYRKYQNKWKLP
ncbi:MAG: L,D-transpeptidase family protein [Verrucomicrobiota bacterium]